MIAYEKKFSHGLDRKFWLNLTKNLTGNHYKTVSAPVRSEYYSCRMFKMLSPLKDNVSDSVHHSLLSVNGALSENEGENDNASKRHEYFRDLSSEHTHTDWSVHNLITVVCPKKICLTLDWKFWLTLKIIFIDNPCKTIYGPIIIEYSSCRVIQKR